MDRVALTSSSGFLCVTPGFLLLAAALYFVGGGAALTAFITAALAHELGHLTLLWMSGAVVCSIKLTPAGIAIQYSGALTRSQEAGVTAAGPVAGLLFAFCCFLMDMPFFCYAGTIALLASMFNFLPVLPLDGGRLAEYALETILPSTTTALILRIVGSLCALGVTGTGLYIRSPAAAAAGIWLLVLANTQDLR